MSRLVSLCLAAIATAALAPTAHASIGDAHRARVVGDVYHTSFLVRLDDGPNGAIRVHRVVRERAPGIPRATRGGLVAFHGDFASFASNFAPITRDPAATPGVAVWLAQQGFDVWGVDRRWAVTAADGDVSDFGAMGFAQEIDDAQIALAIARTLRVLTGSGADRLHVLGFSRGGFLAYAVAAADGARPAWRRQVKGLIPVDVWAELPPDATAARALICEAAFYERLAVSEGVVDSDNFLFINIARRALSDPDAPTPIPFLAGFTNRGAFLFVAAQTYNFFTPTPFYKLAAGAVEGGEVTHLTESPEPVILNWFATASPHQSLREAADTDSLWCGDGSASLTVDLAAIRVPLFYLGAGGGYGAQGLYSTTRVSSTDVSSHIVTRGGDPFEDFGHGDLLFATDARALAWQPLATWLGTH